MKIRKRSKSVKIEPPALVLAINGCSRSIEFPPELVDSVRYMATRLMYKKTFPSRFALVSSLRQEGVTFVSRALATVLANDMESRICLVELNWWWPDDLMETAVSPNTLAHVLKNESSLVDAIMPTNFPNLFVLSAGKMPIAERPIWARSTQIKDVIEKLNQEYDYVILDIPAILATNDAIPLASLAMSCGLIINQGVTSFENTSLALDEISHLSVAGVILNKVKTSTPSWILKLIPQDSGSVESI